MATVFDEKTLNASSSPSLSYNNSNKDTKESKNVTQDVALNGFINDVKSNNNNHNENFQSGINKFENMSLLDNNPQNNDDKKINKRNFNESKHNNNKNEYCGNAKSSLPFNTISQLMEEFLKNSNHKSLMFRYPRFAIKSYGKEKRYLCPPPHISIHGSRWNSDFEEKNIAMYFKNIVRKNYHNTNQINDNNNNNNNNNSNNNNNYYGNFIDPENFGINNHMDRHVYFNSIDSYNHNNNNNDHYQNIRNSEDGCFETSMQNRANYFGKNIDNNHNDIQNHYDQMNNHRNDTLFANFDNNISQNPSKFDINNNSDILNRNNTDSNNNNNNNNNVNNDNSPFNLNSHNDNNSNSSKKMNFDESKNKEEQINNNVYCIVDLPGVRLPDNGHIEFDETNNGYATRIYIPENKDQNQSIVLNSANSFTFSVGIFTKNLQICEFSSNQIKLKSKALSYTKQGANNSCEDMCLLSGSVVSLYSRVHAHKSNTRFLYTSESKFLAHPLYWDSYIIYKVSEDSDEAEFNVIKGTIFYGDYVKIVSTKDNVTLPTMKIKPVNSVNTPNDNKPVQYLSRIAFQMRYNPNLYFCIVNQKNVMAEKALIRNKKDSNFHMKEESIWTITRISVNCYSFLELAAPTMPISPFPVIFNIVLQGSPKNYYIKLIGSDLTADFSVWLGSKYCSTYFQSSETLLAVLPAFSSLSQYLVDDFLMQLPVNLLRRDLVVYSTQFTLQFRFNSFLNQPNDFTFVAKYDALEQHTRISSNLNYNNNHHQHQQHDNNNSSNNNRHSDIQNPEIKAANLIH